MNKSYAWYQKLKKPTWAPPSWLFGPVWTILYILIAISFGTIFYETFAGKLSWLTALPFALNLIFNFSYTPLQFGLKNNYLAAIDIILILGTLAWSLLVIYSYAHWIAFVNIPYFLWVAFATVLQLTVTYLNKE